MHHANTHKHTYNEQCSRLIRNAFKQWHRAVRECSARRRTLQRLQRSLHRRLLAAAWRALNSAIVVHDRGAAVATYGTLLQAQVTAICVTAASVTILDCFSNQ
jgi:hypothetical protein